MKYINKFLALAIVSGVSLATVSCSDDYLETKPTTAISTPDALGSTENLMMALNAIPDIMKTQHANFRQGFCGENNIISQYENYPSQDFVYNSMAPGWDVIFLQQYHDRTSSIYCAYAWYYYYQIIANANNIIDNVDNATGSQEEKDYIKGAALTYRAYAYEKLAHYYCYRWSDTENGTKTGKHYGLVLRTSASIDNQALSPLGEVFAQIYKDLDAATELLDGKARPAFYLPDAGTAHAVYARAALWREDYAKAYDEAQAALEVHPQVQYSSAAQYATAMDTPNGEWILGTYGDEEENMWYWSFATQFSCNGYYAGIDYGTGSISRELAAKIDNKDIRKQLFLTEDKLSKPVDEITTDAYFSEGWIGIDYAGQGYGVADRTLYFDTLDWLDAIQLPDYSEAYSVGMLQLGAQAKFWCKGQPGISHQAIIRSSEMVLIMAEAAFKKGDAREAAKCLNDLNAYRCPGYSATGLSSEDLWEEIVAQRGIELWGEGFQWSDFKRWSRPCVRVAIENGGSVNSAVAGTITPTMGLNWTWEIPEIETQYNDKLFEIEE